MLKEPSTDRFRHIVFDAAPVSTRVRSRSDAARHERSARAHRKAAALHRHPEPSPADVQLIDTILEHAGLNPRSYRLAPLLRRLPACLRAIKARSVSHAYDVMVNDTAQWRVALDALLIGVTQFYRDDSVFNLLHRQVLPMLLRDRSSLDVHSTACSDGAELYTMAVLLAEHGVLAGSRLLGTDCRSSAIAQARAARYSYASLASLPLEWRQRYFHRQAGTAAPLPELMANIEWQRANALCSQDVEQWDVILCRNVAIYLEASVTTNLWRQLTRALRPGGVLVVGKAERPVADGLSRLAGCIYIKDSAVEPRALS